MKTVWFVMNLLVRITVYAAVAYAFLYGEQHQLSLFRSFGKSHWFGCSCGETQTMSHIVESCPQTRLHGGLCKLHSADDDAVAWLTSYDS